MLPKFNERLMWDILFHGSVPLIPQSSRGVAELLLEKLPWLTFDDSKEKVDLSSLKQQYEDTLRGNYDFGHLGLSSWLDRVRTSATS